MGTQKNRLTETVLRLNETVLLSTQNSHMGKKENNNNLHLSFCLSKSVLYQIHHLIIVYTYIIYYAVSLSRHFMLVKHRKTENHPDMTEKLLREGDN